MICSKNKLGSELDKIKQLLIQNGYPADVLLSCINQKLANFAAEKTFGPEKCPVYLKLPRIGNVSSKFENQNNKAITSCFYTVKPRVVYSSIVMLPSAKKDSVPTTQKSCVVYEFSCRCEARYVGRTTRRLLLLQVSGLEQTSTIMARHSFLLSVFLISSVFLSDLLVT